jgi:uncharacterized protein DUF4154
MAAYDKTIMKVTITIILIVMLSIAAPCAGAKLSKAIQKEYEIKTAFIYNFLKFIEWPKPVAPKLPETEKDNPKAKTITLGFVVNPEVFGVCKVLHGKKIKSKTLRAIRFDAIPLQEIQAGKKSKVLAALRTCDVLFFCGHVTTPPKSASTLQVLTALKDEPILIIGDMPGFIEPKAKDAPCGIFNFLLEDKKIRFEVNHAIANKKGFIIKAQLLKLAKRVIQTEKKASK